MPTHRTCAVVITYHPEPSVFVHLSSLQCEADGLVVVDNGSDPVVIEKLRSASQATGFHLIENGENRGVAAALNSGVRWAIENKFQWVALFDQDSSVPEGYLATMHKCAAAESDRERIAIFAPQYRGTLDDRLHKSLFTAEDGAPLEVMTSGSLMPVWIFEKCGWFEEAFFIDQVDHEFCFRVRTFGYRVRLCDKAIINHLPGSARVHKLLGLKWVTLTDHSPGRRYYQTRNGLILARRYRKQYPLWSRMTRKNLLWDNPLTILFAEAQRCKKLVNVARGIVDACLGRMGKHASV